MMLTARQAADRLGVKLDTLYAYVSRGRLRSVAMSGTRARRYRAQDVEALLAARGGGGTSIMADMPTPVLVSAISLIEEQRLYYRGRDALDLAVSASLEEVASLLWQAGAVPDFADPGPPPRRFEPASGLIERCQIALARLAGEDLAALDLSRAGVIRTGSRILGVLASCLGTPEPRVQPVHRRLAAAWRLSDSGADILRRGLVLAADHELNASTFVARCVASTGAVPYAVVGAALGALSGRRHGGATIRAEAQLRDPAAQRDPLTAAAGRLARDEPLAGFGQLLYPDGDPRATALLEALAQAAPDTWPAVAAAAEAGFRLTGRRPNIDFALAAVGAGLLLPPGAAFGLFVIGRAVGWIAHAIEQYESGVLIRPRARYAGPRPQPIAQSASSPGRRW